MDRCQNGARRDADRWIVAAGGCSCHAIGRREHANYRLCDGGPSFVGDRQGPEQNERQEQREITGGQQRGPAISLGSLAHRLEERS